MIPQGTTLTAGQKLRAVSAQHSGQVHLIGTMVTVNVTQVVQTPTAYVNVRTDDGINYNLFADELDFGWKDRSEHALFVELEIQDLNKKVAEKQHLAKRLREFNSDEDEIASVLISAVDGSDLPREERISNLAKLLKGRLKTDLI